MSEERTSEPESPCIAVCVPDPDTGYCLGCFRTLDEIAAWTTMTAAEKHAVLAALKKREQEASS